MVHRRFGFLGIHVFEGLDTGHEIEAAYHRFGERPDGEPVVDIVWYLPDGVIGDVDPAGIGTFVNEGADREAMAKPASRTLAGVKNSTSRLGTLPKNSCQLAASGRYSPPAYESK